MRYSAQELMRRGARPCGDGSPGPGRGRGGRWPPNYKSQKPAGSPPSPAPRSLPGPAGRGEKRQGWCPGQRAAGAGKDATPGGEKASLGFGGGDSDRNPPGGGGWRVPPEQILPGKIPASPLRPPSRLSGSRGTTRALKSATGEVRVPLGSAAETHAGSRVLRETEF